MAMPDLETRNRTVRQAAADRHGAVNSRGCTATARSRPCELGRASEMPMSISRFVAVLLVLLAGLPLSAIAAPVFTVNAVGDAKAGGNLANGICQTASNNSVCTLRAAITKANRYPGGGITINIPAGTYKIEIPPATPRCVVVRRRRRNLDLVRARGNVDRYPAAGVTIRFGDGGSKRADTIVRSGLANAVGQVTPCLGVTHGVNGEHRAAIADTGRLARSTRRTATNLEIDIGLSDARGNWRGRDRAVAVQPRELTAA